MNIPLTYINTLPSAPDQRDIPFVMEVQPRDFKPFVDLMPNVEEVEDQGSIGSCAANGLVSQCEFLGKANGVSYDLSRLFLYTATLAFEKRLGQEGLYVRDAYKIAHRHGICDENGPFGYPYDESKSAIQPPDQFYFEAYKQRVQRYEAVIAPRSGTDTYEKQEKIDRIKSALNSGLPVGIGMSVTDSIRRMAGPWKEQQYIVGATPGAPAYIGGHYMVIIGYDDVTQKFLVLNSWGKGWGDGGFGGFPYDIVEEMFFEAWIVRNFNGHGPKEAPGIKFETQNLFTISARIIPEEHEIGKEVNIWMGAVHKNKVFLRKPIPLEEMNPAHTKSGYDNWERQTGSVFTPTVTGVILQKENPVRVVQWMNLNGLGGTEVYLGYGTSQLTWKLTKLCTIPDYRV